MPTDWVPPVNLDGQERIVITPAIMTVPYTESGSASSSPQTVSPSLDGEIQQQAQAVDALLQLADTPDGALSFPRVRISEKDEKIFGSVTELDICNQLQSQLQVQIKPEWVKLLSKEGGESLSKLKEIGHYIVAVQVPVFPNAIQIPVHVLPL